MADAREIEQRLSIPLSQTRNSSVALGMPSMQATSGIWRIKPARVPEGEKVRITNMYLAGDAKPNSGGEDGWRMMLMLAVLRLKDGKF